jgi:preprotein translocase subunit SecA
VHLQAVTRVLGAVERRLDESLGLSPAQFTEADWDEVEDAVYQAVEAALERRVERLAGEDGLIAKDMEANLAKVSGSISSDNLLPFLLLMPQGTRAEFDKKTHKRVVKRTTRLTYIYAAAHLLDGRDPDEVAGDVLKHLELAQDAVRQSWGLGAWPQLAGARWDDLAEWLQERLQAQLGAAACQSLRSAALSSLPHEQVRTVIDMVGRRMLTEVYRPLLLGVISELWVEYLTQMEALRVSIGLEAYAQRDPLVQYKSKASELFQNLLSSMRLGVVSRMFTYRPRQLPGSAIGLRQGSSAVEAPSESALEPASQPEWDAQAGLPTLEAEAELLPKNGEADFDDQTDQPETEPADDQEPEAQSGAGKLSRSQRRRKRRR